MQYRLTYIITTFNKSRYLRHTLERLMAARQPDEEIVVTDGGSTDGTVDYLQGHFAAGRIQQFVSEPDRGEAHGFNKAIMMARGEMIKFISDDDAFAYPVIRAVTDFALANPQIAAINGYNASTQVEDLTYAVVKEQPARDFQLWLETKQPFWMIGLPLMIRRSALPLTGLLYTNTKFPDLDFLYRISTSGAKMAWCTAVMSMHVSHPEGNFNQMASKARELEYQRISGFYLKPKPRNPVQVVRDLVEQAKRPIRPAKRAFFDRMGWAQVQNPEVFPTGYVPVPGEDPLDAVYRVCDEFIAAQNAVRKLEFIY
jgi:glycosyltransferase involved in cell wall biosynthesis